MEVSRQLDVPAALPLDNSLQFPVDRKMYVYQSRSMIGGEEKLPDGYYSNPDHPASRFTLCGISNFNLLSGTFRTVISVVS
jgi:hypothetical protein